MSFCAPVWLPRPESHGDLTDLLCSWIRPHDQVSCTGGRAGGFYMWCHGGSLWQGVCCARCAPLPFSGTPCPQLSGDTDSEGRQQQQRVVHIGSRIKAQQDCELTRFLRSMNRWTASMRATATDLFGQILGGIKWDLLSYHPTSRLTGQSTMHIS